MVLNLFLSSSSNLFFTNFLKYLNKYFTTRKANINNKTVCIVISTSFPPMGIL